MCRGFHIYILDILEDTLHVYDFWFLDGNGVQDHGRLGSHWM